MAAELDRAFTNIVSGKLDSANRQLWGIETVNPVMYDFSCVSNQLQFSIGGYVAGGAPVQTTTNLIGAWQTVRTYTASTNLMLFTTNIPAQPPRSFFRVR